MNSRNDPTTISEGDRYIFADGVNGFESTFLKLVRAGKQSMRKHKRTLTILYEYDSRRERDCETTEMNVVETITMKYPLKVPVKDRVVGFTGQNTCNGVGPIPCAKLEDALKLTWAENDGCQHSSFGAATSDADISKANPRKEDDEELAL